MVPIDPRTDSELIAAANGGDEAAFTALYHRHSPFAVRLAQRFTGNGEDAADVVQETFLYLLKKFPGFHLTAAMTTFLYPVVRNLSLEAVRKRRRSIGDDTILLALPAPTPADHCSPDLAAVVSSLTDPLRETLLLRYVDGLSLEEISQALEIPLGTVKSRLHNALQLLREDQRTRRYFDQP